MVRVPHPQNARHAQVKVAQKVAHRVQGGGERESPERRVTHGAWHVLVGYLGRLPPPYGLHHLPLALHRGEPHLPSIRSAQGAASRAHRKPTLRYQLEGPTGARFETRRSLSLGDDEVLEQISPET